MKFGFRLALGVLAMASLAACSNQPSGQTGGTSSGSDSTSSTASGPAAPKVASPLDASKYIKNPCSSISPAELKTLTVLASPSATPDNTEGQPQCHYNGGAEIGIAWLVADKNGLSDVYARKSGAKYWAPVSIDGYPAVLNSTVDDRSDGMCGLDMGISDTTVVDVQFESGPGLGTKSCTYAQQGAKAVIATLRGNS